MPFSRAPFTFAASPVLLLALAHAAMPRTLVATVVQRNTRRGSELVAAVCFALGAILTLLWLVWKALAWWFSQ